MANLTLAGWTEIALIEGIEALPTGDLALYCQDNIPGFFCTANIDLSIDQCSIVRLNLKFGALINPPPIQLVWKVPAINLKGTWTSNYERPKRIFAEWESAIVHSRTAYETPVIGLFGHDNQNLHTFACSDAINLLVMGAGLREEEAWVYCTVQLFTEPGVAIEEYNLELRLDSRPLRYEKALEEVADWWASFPKYTPMPAPDLASKPMYSTWYNFHQELIEPYLLWECRQAVKIGCETIIIDDGWQTKDSNRGYAFTGDWQADRFEDMAGFVSRIHDLGMKVMLWYSVPFFGRESEAYQKFQGKFLTESEEFKSAIIDPRYPDVREYLIEVYTKALQEWQLDGFKLDFIDHIIPYAQTEFTKANGRDYASINDAVDRLMTDISKALRALKPDIMLEFRQHYISPVMRKFGNIFRAHDCPNDASTNRRRTIDLRLLSGNTVVHSDMFMWNKEEPTHLAALQILHILFSVPQLSVRLKELSDEHFEMVQFYTLYWIDNRDILLTGTLKADNPLQGYPLIEAEKQGKKIIALYDNLVLDVSAIDPVVFDVVNAKTSTGVVLNIQKENFESNVVIKDCRGQIQSEEKISRSRGVHYFEVPPSGLMQFKK